MDNEQKLEIYTPYERAQKEVLDCYYEVMKSYPAYISKYRFMKKNDINMLDRWRNNLFRLYLLAFEWEKDELKGVEFNEKNMGKLDWLERTTRTILNLESLRKLSSIGRVLRDFDPIVTYRKENYNIFTEK